VFLIFIIVVSGTKEKTLIDILTHRSSAQRQLICEAYQEATGRVRAQGTVKNHNP